MSINEEPERFYKYRSLSSKEDQDRVRQIVVDSQIYFSSARSFNDPFDLHPTFDLTASPDVHRRDCVRLAIEYGNMSEVEAEAEADRIMLTSLSAERIAETEQGIQAVHNWVMQRIGVLCVSTKSNDILMWPHYADSHKGICLEFDARSSFMISAQKVLYSQERDPINPYLNREETMLEKALLTKSQHWAYESEYRLLQTSKGPGLVPFNPEVLTSIIIGVNADSATIDLVRSWNQKRAKPLLLYRAWASRKKYELEIRQFV